MTSSPTSTLPLRRGLTLWFGLVLALWCVHSFVAFVGGRRHLMVHVVACLPALYFLCICIHDGVHGVMHRRRRVNQSVSWVLSLCIFLPFPLLQASHLKHHRRVGHVDDPEYVIYSQPLHKVVLHLPLVPFYYLRSFTSLSTTRQLLTVLHLLTSSAFLALASWHLGVDVVALGWLLPVLLSIAWFGFTTVYAPHCDDADVWMRFLTTHSGWHHDHHLDVRYPFPQYIELRRRHLDDGTFASTALERRVVHTLASSLAQLLRRGTSTP